MRPAIRCGSYVSAAATIESGKRARGLSREDSSGRRRDSGFSICDSGLEVLGRGLAED